MENIGRMKVYADFRIDSVPLEKAMLCEDCSQIAMRQALSRCPLCGSDALLDLKKILGIVPRSGPAIPKAKAAGGQ